MLSIPFKDNNITNKLSKSDRLHLTDLFVIRLLLLGLDNINNILIIDNLENVSVTSLNILIVFIQSMKYGKTNIIYIYNTIIQSLLL